MLLELDAVLEASVPHRQVDPCTAQGRYKATWKSESKLPLAQGRCTKIVLMINWIRTSRLSIKNYLSLQRASVLERTIFVHNLLVRVHFIIEMI